MSDTMHNDENEPTPVSPATVNVQGIIIPAFSFSGLGFNMTLSDISATILSANKPTAMIVMSPTMAKTFAEGLTEMVNDYERRLDIKVHSLKELKEKFLISGEQTSADQE